MALEAAVVALLIITAEDADRRYVDSRFSFYYLGVYDRTRML